MAPKRKKTLTARRRGRLLALETLYQLDLRGTGSHADAMAHLASAEAEPVVREYAHRLVEGVLETLETVDRAIRDSASNWQLDRLAAIDRTILRIATFEMLHGEDVPPKVAINEAIEVAKSYSTSESGHFVNGVLDQIRRRVESSPERPA